jgi:hypothetical protein
MDTTIQCCIEYVEDYMKVLHVGTNKTQAFDSGVFVEMTRLASEEATDALDEGKTVLVPRGKTGIIEITDLYITDGGDELQIIKDGICFRARMHVNNEMAMLKAFDFFEFTLCNNKLASHGIFIHDENREEKYIEIINSGNEKLIECLETYLNTWDSVSDVYKNYKDLNDFVSKVQTANTPEDVQELVDNFHYMV